MAGEYQCLSEEENKLFLEAYDRLLEILGIDDEIEEVRIKALDPKGEPYQVVIRFNKRKLCWEAKVI